MFSLVVVSTRLKITVSAIQLRPWSLDEWRTCVWLGQGVNALRDQRHSGRSVSQARLDYGPTYRATSSTVLRAFAM
jgi:hypothetical protein